ncbi:chitin synthase-domain-containing protein [Chytriomyces sp. MP71]|nr:chitin synthase-domain-containing protein [Chytriomyces sp. MP71]
MSKLNPFSAAAVAETAAPSTSDDLAQPYFKPSSSSSSTSGYYSSSAANGPTPTPDSAAQTLRARVLSGAHASRIGSRALVSVRPIASVQAAVALSDSTAKAHAQWARDLTDLQKKHSETASGDKGLGVPAISVFDISASAWWHLKRGAEDQAIVLLGETGTGKSDSRKLITRHLCDISTLKPGSQTKKKKSKLVSSILRLDSIFAAFSRACTAANPTASTAGSYLEYQFNKKAKIVGVKVIDFLMDRGRVTGASDHGCNFNVFYLLVEGASKEEKTQWQLGDSAHYHYLNVAGIRYSPPANGSGVDMETLRESLKSVGIGKRHQTQIFQLLSAILHLGNISFLDDPNKADEPCTVKNQQQLSLVADLLGVHPATLEACLTYKTQIIRKDKISIFLDSRAASEQRDSLARVLYSVVLSYLVEQINNALCVTDESAWSNFVAVVDLPGSFFGGHAPGGESGHAFQRLLVNYANARMEAFMVEQLFALPRDVLKAEGLAAPPTVPGVKRALVEALDSDTGLLRAVDLECAVGTKGSKLMERLRDREAVAAGGAVPQTGFVVLTPGSPAVVADGSKRGKHMFTVTHYVERAQSGRYGGNEKEMQELLTLQYDARGFVEANTDVLQSDFVTLVRGSQDNPGTSSPFLRGLFSDRMVATLTHAGDTGTVVAAVERSRFPSLKRGSSSKKEAGIVGVDSTVSQKFRSSLDGVLETLADTQSWFILHVKQTDDPANTKFDADTFKRQIQNMAVPALMQNSALLYSAAFRHADFLTRFNPILVTLFGEFGGSNPRAQCEELARVAGWDVLKAKVGTTKMFLAENVWRQLEDGLCAIEEADKSAARALRNNGGSEFMESEYGVDTEYYGESAAGDFDDGESHFDSEFGVGERAGGGIPMGSMKAGGSGKATDAMDVAEQGRLLAKGATGPKGKSELVKKKMSKQRCLWVSCTWCLTWWVPSPFLKCAGMRTADRRMAWREKLALCIIIAFLNALILFFIIGIGLILCPVRNQLSAGQISAKNRLNQAPLVYMYGTYYSAQDIYNSHQSLDIATNQLTQGYWEAQVFGQDVSQMFDKSYYWSTYCGAYAKPATFTLFPNQLQAITSGQWYQHGRTGTPARDFMPLVRSYRKGEVVWDSGSIGTLLGGNNRVIVAYDKVYDVTAFYSQAYKGKNFMGPYVQDLFDTYGAKGVDTTQYWEYLKTNDRATWANATACMDNMFYIGPLDHRNDLKCQVQNYILLAASAVLVLVIGVKFLAALQFGGKRVPEDHDKFVICLVPCYTEGESSLVKTIESLANLEYEDKHKLIFVVADGMIIGSGNDRPTPRIVLDILGVDPALDPESKSFESLGEGGKQHNHGKVYSGLYECNGRVVPYIVVVKVGRPNERQRPGNRGKRDSQLILMRYLSRVHFNQPMNPLELEMYHHMKNIIGVDPSFYEFIFSIDADTEPYRDSLNRLISTMARDSKIIGLCGETLLANERESWVSMMQVYEYYISHNLAKAFESLFGSVTCLPGCFSIYRIRTPVKNIPLLIAPGVLQDYSENDVNTLHLKNLLYLGEDRYLTTLLMKHFPHMKTTFTSDAKCKTVGPAKFAVLLSQRRRWINSTVHNLMELLALRQLCGVCCFDMRFVVFIDLFATFVQPATLAYIAYLIYAATSNPEQFSFPLISIIMIAAIYGFQIIIFILKREWQHIGWMIVYFLCIPFSALYIPLYAFWHFDDFSWGNTRVVVEDGQTKEVEAEFEPYNPAEIVLQKWPEYEAQRLKQIEASPARSATPGITAGLTSAVPSYRNSAVVYGSPYAGSAYGAVPMAGSAYGAMIPQQVAGSVYGSAYGQVPMMGVPVAGSVYGGSQIGAFVQPGFPNAPVLQQPGYAASVLSGGSTNRSQPSDEEILFQIRQILASADLMTVTRKSVREELGRFFGVDLSSRKEYIHACIDGVLKGEL